jgi:ubiquinone/menaquinone biosynthesis C-methylase UbiE
MAEAGSPQERRFRSAARYYLSGRPAYSARLIRHVARITGLTRAHRVLDLGCGPGVLAGAFAGLAGEVVAMDPEPEMLRIAAAQFAGVGRISFVQGGSLDLSPALGSFRLVTMGRSFHWMDRAETLRRLDAIIEPGGAVALFDSTHANVPENAWYEAYRAVVRRYAADDAAHVRRRSGTWVRHEAFLLDSVFSVLDEIAVIERRRVSVRQLIDRAFSRSSTAPDRLGERARELAAEIERVLGARGALTEVVSTVALIGSRTPATFE